MVKITLIRHGQSDGNVETKLEPERLINPHLTELGIKQASSLDFKFDLLILSPLKRALETYTFSKIKTGEVVINPLFREQTDFTSSRLELEQLFPETKEGLIKRVIQAIEFLKTIKDDYEHIGIVSHYLFLEIFTELTLGKKQVFNNCQTLELEL
jgi:broad specificity phosphatase PhoE